MTSKNPNMDAASIPREVLPAVFTLPPKPNESPANEPYPARIPAACRDMAETP